MVRHLKERYTYDAKRGVLVNKRKNRVVKGFNSACGYLYLYLRVDGNRHGIQLHRLVWALVYGRFPSQIDHVNGNRKDNRIENLREVSYSENDMNRVWAWKPNAKSGLPGVYKTGDRFQIIVGGKRCFFRDKFEAFFTLTMFGRMFREQ